MGKNNFKKDNAEVLGNFGPIIIGALVTLILIIFSAGWMANFEKRDAVNQITRKYILKMETTGGITDEDKTKLINELTPYGKNIQLEYDGNRTTKKGEVVYGEDVDLYVQIDLYVYNFSGVTAPEGSYMQLQMKDADIETVDDKSSIKGTNHTTTLKIHRSSTSKY